MAELVSQSTVALESCGVSRDRLYRYTTPDDLKGFRDEAAQWAFGRSLKPLETLRLMTAIGDSGLLRGVLIVQQDPIIALKRNPTGVTMEVFGSETIEEGKIGRVSYPSSRPALGRVHVELIEKWPFNSVLEE